MKHVRITDEQSRLTPNVGALRTRRITIVGRIVRIVQCLKRLEIRQLILSESFRREKIQSSGGRVPEQSVEDRQIVAQSLARGSTSDDHNIFPTHSCVDRLSLVRERLFNALRFRGVN